MSVDLATAVRTAVEQFPSDPSAPSLIVSWLSVSQEYYVSFVRYAQRFGGSKFVIASARSSDLGTALATVLEEVHGE